MSSGDQSGRPPGPENQDESPIGALANQELQPSPDFWASVRRSIYRREAVSQLASYSWDVPKVVLTELFGVIRHLFFALGGRKES